MLLVLRPNLIVLVNNLHKEAAVIADTALKG